MAKKRAFVSFDYDTRIKDLLAGQAKNADSPLELANWSIKEHMTGDWKEKARKRIRAVDVVCVLCGEKTHTATGVAAKASLAREERKEYFLLKGYAKKVCTKLATANATNKLYAWHRDNLKVLIGGGC